METPSNASLIEAAHELLRTAGYFVDNLWHIRDVQLICEQLDLDRLEPEEAMEVFHIAYQQFDGERGVSWPQLEKALRTYLHRKLVLSAMCDDL